MFQFPCFDYNNAHTIIVELMLIIDRMAIILKESVAFTIDRKKY